MLCRAGVEVQYCQPAGHALDGIEIATRGL